MYKRQAQLTFTIAIAEDLAPTFSTTIGDKAWKQYDQISAFTLPSATGGDGSLTYSIRPALPTGVTKNASHQVSGTPSVKLASTEYTWTARDADGDTASLTFDIAIDGVPRFNTAVTASDQTWTQYQQIAERTHYLPSAYGGDGDLTYTLSPALPSGVILSLIHI